MLVSTIKLQAAAVVVVVELLEKPHQASVLSTTQIVC